MAELPPQTLWPNAAYGFAQECNSLKVQLAARDREIERLRDAGKAFMKFADQARDFWDSDQDSKVGKLLIAMSGKCKGYRHDVDEAIAALDHKEEPTT